MLFYGEKSISEYSRKDFFAISIPILNYFVYKIRSDKYEHLPERIVLFKMIFYFFPNFF